MDLHIFVAAVSVQKYLHIFKLQSNKNIASEAICSLRLPIFIYLCAERVLSEQGGSRTAAKEIDWLIVDGMTKQRRTFLILQVSLGWENKHLSIYLKY